MKDDSPFEVYNKLIESDTERLKHLEIIKSKFAKGSPEYNCFEGQIRFISERIEAHKLHLYVLKNHPDNHITTKHGKIERDGKEKKEENTRRAKRDSTCKHGES